MIQVLVSLGSNIDRKHHIKSGLKALKECDPHCRHSRIFEAEPVGFEGANFYNVVVELHTSLSLKDILCALREIELRLGGAREGIKFRPRRLDIDLLTYGDCCQKSEPSLPRDDIYKYAFVLQPLAELCPEQCIPGDTQTYKQAWDAFNKEQSLWPITERFLREK